VGHVVDYTQPGPGLPNAPTRASRLDGGGWVQDRPR
jgi:hypothetical protein